MCDVKRSFILLVVPLLLVWGCSDDNGPVAVAPTYDDLVIANALAFQKAVEAFAAENNGGYPYNAMRDTTLAGNTVWDLLPGGFRNPFLGTFTTLSYGTAVFGGRVGYRVPDKNIDPQTGRAFSTGYLINAVGKSGEVISLRRNYADNILVLEQQVIDECYTLQTAVEAFAADNNGAYPADVWTATNSAGRTVLDYLPGGALLKNAFTQANTEPAAWIARNPGEIGYSPIYQMMAPTGYHITGWGNVTLVVVLSNFWWSS